jgi:cytochrome P450
MLSRSIVLKGILSMTLDAATKSAPVMPGPKGLPVLGSINSMRSQGVLKFYFENWKTYGDVVQFKLGPLPAFQFVRPEHIQHIMVKNPDVYVKGMSHDRLRTAIGHGILTLEGSAWQQQRRLMQPTYTPRGIRRFAELMVEEAQKLTTSLTAQRAAFDINGEMTRTTMSVISRAMFGVDISTDFRDTAKALYELLDYTASSAAAIVPMPLFIPTPGNLRLKHAKVVIRNFIMGIVEQRRREGLQEDLLSLLMSSKDEDTGEVMPDDQLHDEVLVTFFAGHETTATLLTWTFYLLSHYPEVEAKLHAELAQVLNGRTPTLDDLNNLPYTRMVLDDALRLYSPVTVMARDAAREDVVDGYTIPKGAMVTVVPYATHRHPEFWEKPLEFYPEHFTEDRVAQRPRYAYFPFGAGQRICIGNHFAQMEAALILAEVAQRVKLRLVQPEEIGVKFIGVIRPEKPIMMTVQPR